MANMQLIPIPPEDLEQAWGLVAPFAQQIAERFPDEWPLEATASAAQARELQLWVVWDGKQALAAVGTQIVTKPSGKRVLSIAWTAGEYRKKWMHLRSVLEEYAGNEGCAEIEIKARFGWKADLPDYRCVKMAFYRKELTNGRQQSELGT